MRLRFERHFTHHRARQKIRSPIVKVNMRIWKEAIGLPDLSDKKLCNATNSSHD